MDNKGDNLVIFGSYPDAVSAYIIKGVLNTNGIDCVITNERMSSILPMQGLPVSEVRLLVRSCDFDEATRIVESNEGEPEDN